MRPFGGQNSFKDFALKYPEVCNLLTTNSLKDFALKNPDVYNLFTMNELSIIF